MQPPNLWIPSLWEVRSQRLVVFGCNLTGTRLEGELFWANRNLPEELTLKDNFGNHYTIATPASIKGQFFKQGWFENLITEVLYVER